MHVQPVGESQLMHSSMGLGQQGVCSLSKPHLTHEPFRQNPAALLHESLFGAFRHTLSTQRLQGPQSLSLLQLWTQLPPSQTRPLAQARPSQLLSAQSR
jgi:hypothetical protein